MINTICCIGDSLTAIGGGSVSKNITNRLAEKYPRLYFVNLGVSGDGVNKMIARETSIAPYAPIRTIVWGGINDIPNGTSAATIEGWLQTLYTYAASLGSEVWAMTITPRDDNTSPMITVRNTVNAWIGGLPSPVARVIDAYTIIRDPNNVNIRLAAYSDNPTTPNHLTDAGMAAIVSAI
jgi:hypothetical protein